MSLAIRELPEATRGPLSLGVSGMIHGAFLAWVALGPPIVFERRLSMYDQEIRPHEKRLVWYQVGGRLPDISPAPAGRTGPARARVKFNQTVVAGKRDDPSRPPQMIWMPEAEAVKPKLAPLPNVLLVAPPKILRAFKPPPAAEPVRNAVAKIPEAPTVPMPAIASANRSIPLRGWTPPQSAPGRRADAVIPEAPAAAVPRSQVDMSLLANGAARPIPRSWTPPAAPSARGGAQALPDAPATAAAVNSPVSLAIVGLNPAKGPEFTRPTESQSVGFSAGPELRAEGRASGGGRATLVVPGLLARGGGIPLPPLPRRELLAPVRPPAEPPLPAASAMPGGAARVSSAPDPRLDGRVVYSMAIQMPNVTSYYGSWMVWFAERDRAPGDRTARDVRPPVPVRKVDPKYIASAVSERVEGVVRLFAVIRKDGRVDSVSIIRHLDDRLDQSAVEALAKWQFNPAVSHGAAVDVDAVFEIPFRLAPRAAR